MRDSLLDDLLLMFMLLVMMMFFIGAGILVVQHFERQDCEAVGGEYKRERSGDLWPDCKIPLRSTR